MSSSDFRPRYTPAIMDTEHLAALRRNIGRFLGDAAKKYAKPNDIVLDVAPQNNEGAAPYFPAGTRIETLDIDPASGCTYIADLCCTNEHLPSNRFNIVVCTEVLEHTLQPFSAVAELCRVLSEGGHLLLTTPYNFRIHGPLPDCWRFTEHGLRVLLQGFKILSLDALETPDRPLMPIQYTVVAKKV